MVNLIVFSRKKYKPLSIKLITNSIFILYGFLGQTTISFKKLKIEVIDNTKFKIFLLNYKPFFKLFTIYYLGVSFGWYLKLEISGRGFFVHILKQIGFFNLGFSHGVAFVFFNKGDSLVYEKKKKLKFILHGVNLFNLYAVAYAIKLLRPLNIYKGKGVKFENEFIKLKQGKKSNY
jgi:hypothetical protein